MNLIKAIKNKSINYPKDIAAGIIVALVSIPISMGYAGIAGLPAVYGLYGSVLPIFLFAFITSSPQFVVGVDAMPAVMVGSILTVMGVEGESPEAIGMVPLMSFLVMIWFVFFYLVKAGRIVKYISKPVMGGFISGVGFTIILMQIPKLFGGTTGTGEIFELISHIIDEFTSFNLLSFILGLSTVLIILISKKIIPKLPTTVLMMLLGAGLQAFLGLDKYGVKHLPDVMGDSFSIRIPEFSFFLKDPSMLMLEAFSIAAVIMAQTLLASGNYALKYGDELDNNRELLAYAAMNFAAMLVGSCPINGSVSRSGIADSYGARSQIMSLSAAITMLVVILCGKPVLAYLPVPVLTGIVMTALIGILEIDLFKRLFRTSKSEWLIFVISFAGVLLFGTVYGVLIGSALSFADVAIAATVPPTAFMGRIPGKGNFYELSRNSAARPVKNAVIYRFSGNLIFANIDKFQTDIEQAIKVDTTCVVIDARAITNIDITAVDRLLLISKNLKMKGINFYLTEHNGSLNDTIRLLGGGELVENGQVRRTISLALRDSGMEKPYILEDEIDDKVHKEEADEMLAEFEWAFGKEAESRLERMAEEAANKITDSLDEGNELDVIEENRLDTSWGKLGRFDENEFWDFLEFRLEEFARKGRLSENDLIRLEKRIEERRIKGEKKLENINPRALGILRKHREKVRNYLKLMNSEEYEHMKKQQLEYYEQLKEGNPELAEAIKELHDSKK